jgi:hypothetical protein
MLDVSIILSPAELLKQLSHNLISKVQEQKYFSCFLNPLPTLRYFTFSLLSLEDTPPGCEK